MLSKLILCFKEYHQEGEKAPYRWEKIFKSHISEKEVLSKTYKKILTIQL